MTFLAGLLLFMGCVVLFALHWRIILPAVIICATIAVVGFGGFIYLTDRAFERDKAMQIAAERKWQADECSHHVSPMQCQIERVLSEK